MQLLPSNVEDLKHGDIFIYYTNIFEAIDLHTEHYKIHPSNTYMTLTLKEKKTERVYRFVQSHVPRGPVKGTPAREELAHAIMNDFDPEAITLVMGDMNGAAHLFLEAFEEAAKTSNGHKPPFSNITIPYHTIINTKMHADWIDNLFIANPYPEVSSSVAQDGSEVFTDLQPVLTLLEKLKNHALSNP